MSREISLFVHLSVTGRLEKQLLLSKQRTKSKAELVLRMKG